MALGLSFAISDIVQRTICVYLTFSAFLPPSVIGMFL